jgi:hypothetical protein
MNSAIFAKKEDTLKGRACQKKDLAEVATHHGENRRLHPKW